MKKSISLLIAIVVLFSSAAHGGGASAATAKSDALAKSEQPLELGDFSMTFGFADTDGSFLLVKYDEEDGGAAQEERPEQYTLAIGPYGEILSIRYVGWQDMTGENNYRDSADNFANLPGYKYRVTGGRLKPDQTYCLIAEGTLDKKLIPLVAPPRSPGTPYDYASNPDLADATIGRIEALKKRETILAEQLAATADGAEIGLALFKRQGDDMLFSVVYLEEAESLFWDNDTKYAARDRETNSTWVPGMGDQPGLFRPLFLARLKNGLVLALTWSGPYGESVALLYEDNGRFISRIDYDFFYRQRAD